MLLPAGTGVEVRNGFDGAWSLGFEVAAHVDGGYRLLRCSDRSVLPRTFTSDEVRRTRRTSSMWWV
jgi:hypothetical protein